MEGQSRFFSVMVVGEDPKSLMAPFDANLKVEPYIKYEFTKAADYLKYAIMSLEAVVKQKHELKLEEHLIDNLNARISILKKVTPFEYYQSLTHGMDYTEDGDALSDTNPQAKWVTCREASNFAIKLKLVDGTETYSAKAEDIDWSLMHKVNEDVYKAAWEIVMEDKEPTTDEERLIYENMKGKETYFQKFVTKDKYVSFSTCYWNYAYVDANGWVDINSAPSEYEWVEGFYDNFVTKIKPTDKVTPSECSIDNHL